MKPDKNAQHPLSSRPSTFRYRTLLAELMRIDEHLESGGDKLQSAAAAVHAVNAFLSGDPIAKANGAGKALRILADQLGDAFTGSKQTIFIKDIPRGVRPSRAIDHQRGMVVHALNVLIEAGMTNKDAGDFLQKLLIKAGFKYDEKPLNRDRLLQWREQIGESSPPAATGMARGLQERMPVQICSIEDAKTAATAFVAVIAGRNSN